MLSQHLKFCCPQPHRLISMRSEKYNDFGFPPKVFTLDNFSFPELRMHDLGPHHIGRKFLGLVVVFDSS